MATSILKGLEKSSTTLTGTYIPSAGWTLYKVGRLVLLQVTGFQDIPAGSFTLGATIPQKFRPAQDMTYTLERRNTDNSPIALTVNTNGGLVAYKYGTALSGSNPYNQVLAWFTDN